MKKTRFMKSVLCAALSLVMCVPLAACGSGDSSSPSGAGGTIDINLPLDNDSYNALLYVKSAYQELHPDVEINIQTTQDAVGYARTVQGIILAPDSTKGDIVQVSVVPEYYGTDKIVDFTPYLNQQNTYAEKQPNGSYPRWKDMLESDAYRTEERKQTIPSISYQGNAVVCYYNKKAFVQNGWEMPTNWGEMLTVLQNARTAGYTNPLALCYDEEGCGGNALGWLLRMYIDQYFRDMINTAHSQEGDFSYYEDVDYDWVYDSTNQTIDRRDSYTYNLSRVINAYFNTDDYNMKTAKFADLMKNLYDLTRFADSSYSDANARSAFNNGILNIEGQGQSLDESSVMYIARMDYMSDFQGNVGKAIGAPGGILPISGLNERLGWFLMPAMTDNASIDGGAPEADNVRPLGGPDHHPLGIVNRNQAKTNLCVDFLKFWYSKQGQKAYYEYYSDCGKVAPLMCYVKGYELPSSIKIDTVTLNGDCDLNPYNIFGYGYSDKDFDSDGETVRKHVNRNIYNYLRSDGSNWLSYGTTLDSKIKAGFVNYANWKGLKFTDYTQARNYYTTSPFISVQ